MDYEVIIFGKPAEEYRGCRNCGKWSDCEGMSSSYDKSCEDWKWDETRKSCGTCEHIFLNVKHQPCKDCSISARNPDWKQQLPKKV